MRRRWVYVAGEAHEVAPDYEPAPRSNGDRLLWNDKLYQDDGDPRYHSRSSHREYMRRNNLATADDFTGEWARAAREREARAKGIDPKRKQDIADAYRKLEAGYKPRIARED